MLVYCVVLYMVFVHLRELHDCIWMLMYALAETKNVSAFLYLPLLISTFFCLYVSIYGVCACACASLHVHA